MASIQPTLPAAGARQAAVSVRPFFENRSRAFWSLQAAGWSGYLLLRGASSISNGWTFEVTVPVVVEAIIGYCVTLLLSALYGYYRRHLRRIAGVPLAIVTLLLATGLYAVLDTFNYSFARPQPPGMDLTLLLGPLFLNFTVLLGWSALYFGINFYLIVE